MTKKIKDALAYLGSEYSIKAIDMENVIYRLLENGYDFEISGLDNSRTSFNATVYVWDVSSGKRIVEQITDIKSKESLKDTMDLLIQTYLHIRD